MPGFLLVYFLLFHLLLMTEGRMWPSSGFISGANGAVRKTAGKPRWYHWRLQLGDRAPPRESEDRRFC